MLPITPCPKTINKKVATKMASVFLPPPIIIIYNFKKILHYIALKIHCKNNINCNCTTLNYTLKSPKYFLTSLNQPKYITSQLILMVKSGGNSSLRQQLQATTFYSVLVLCRQATFALNSSCAEVILQQTTNILLLKFNFIAEY